jgi:hypothetical protein
MEEFIRGVVRAAQSELKLAKVRAELAEDRITALRVEKKNYAQNAKGII